MKRWRGAFDYIAKSLSYASEDVLKVQTELISKIKAAAATRAPVVQLTAAHPTAHASPLQRAAAAGHAAGAGAPGLTTSLQKAQVQKGAVQPAAVKRGPAKRSPTAATAVPSIIAIGTSTGGPKALQDLLSALPGDLPVPILIVQHMPVGFTGPFAERLDGICPLDVVEAGNVYLAPAGKHLTVRRRSVSEVVVCLSLLPANALHTPSVDVMKRSVAEVFHSPAMGIILSGMGADGAEGMQAIFREGGQTLGQDQASCVVYGMPRSCEELGVLSEVAPLADIARRIIAAVRQRKPN